MITKKRYIDKFSVKGQVCVITGGGGLLGWKHAEAILEGDGIPVLLDISQSSLDKVERALKSDYGLDIEIKIFVVDITDRNALEQVRDILLREYGRIDVLINNAANNPKVEGGSKNLGAIQFVNFPVGMWNQDIAVGLTGALLCSQVFGEVMERQHSGVVLNISSDYGLISPDQRVYRKDGLPDNQQVVKPVSYSVVKHGIIGLTKYLAVYWADKGIRVNTLCPASLHNGQEEDFVKKLSNLVPLGRMSEPEEYVCTILYMISNCAPYMTGATVVCDGGRTVW